MIPDLVLQQVARAGQTFSDLEAVALVGTVLPTHGTVTSAYVLDGGRILQAEVALTDPLG